MNRIQALHRIGAPLGGLRRRVGGRDSELAQTLVEFSLVIPLFILMLFALVDFGRAFYSWQIITNASREGARQAAVRGDLNAVRAKAYGSFCQSWPGTADCALEAAEVTLTPTNLQGPRGQMTTVRMNYNFEFVTPIGGILNMVSGGTLPSNIDIEATTSMRLE